MPEGFLYCLLHVFFFHYPGNAEGGARPYRLHINRQSQRLYVFLLLCVFRRALQHHAFRDSYPRQLCQCVGKLLVHTDAGAFHTAAHHRNIRHFTESLQGAVLSVFSVHNGKCHIKIDLPKLPAVLYPENRFSPAHGNSGGKRLLLPASVSYAFRIAGIIICLSFPADTQIKHLITAYVYCLRHGSR